MTTGDLAEQFDSGVRARGGEYFRRGAVRLLATSVDEVQAEVQGSDAYAVELMVHRGHLSMFCTCPYFGSDGPCKHVWATLLAVEQKRAMPGLSSVSSGSEIEMIESDWRPPPPVSVPRPPPKPAWESLIDSARKLTASTGVAPSPSRRELRYVIGTRATREAGDLVVEIAERKVRKGGIATVPARLGIAELAGLPDEADRQILTLLASAPLLSNAASPGSYGYGFGYGYGSGSRYGSAGELPSPIGVPALLHRELLPALGASGRCFVRMAVSDIEEPRPVAWDDGPPWRLVLAVSEKAGKGGYELKGLLRREADSVELATPALLLASGYVVFPDALARFDHGGAFGWVAPLREHASVDVPADQIGALLDRVLSMPHVPELDLPESLRFEQVRVAPRPALRIRRASPEPWQGDRLLGDLSFDYQGVTVAWGDAGQFIPRTAERRLIVRDAGAEAASVLRLAELGLRTPRSHGWRNPEPPRRVFELPPRRLTAVVAELMNAGWRVEAEGKLYRSAGAFKLSVSSGIDWFELHGSLEFDGDASAALPALLAAAKRGDGFVTLDDGSVGLLPDDWLQKYGLLAGLGTSTGDHVAFRRSQAGFLDALLATQPEAPVDATFQRVRNELRTFERVRPAKAPPGFVGTLRGYQEDGLGWLEFLRRFGFGGCLADDMGLGKTVQVLALLESRRKTAGRPSLVVVPKSIVWNWIREASTFAPGLRVLDHTGMGRRPGGDHFAGYDLVITTYGTLRRDAAHLKDVRFDYVVLDEAQAIKNAASESSKAARLLQADHRLALSGTPIENHLGELWSLFDFLNPGMLGAARVFEAFAGARRPDPATVAGLAKALRPFILRRTKAEVAKDLPDKHEETLTCEMLPAQRKLYDELRRHYRLSLMGKIERDGIGRSKIQILEALLRLRQAACHPGLLDKARVGDPSAKLEVLLSRLAEVRAEGHKALVFSQFTSLLAIVREHLDGAGVTYEYLDGRTRDRQARVARFQTDAACPLFLISLKAGGLGLNLTAADYVFILDPWWNPAVEAQAVDRAHRIGQTKHVFVYRLICRGTVEEKIAELQEKKRGLAESIINADNSLIRTLGREDLETLLS